jgi:hypothetical protein
MRTCNEIFTNDQGIRMTCGLESTHAGNHYGSVRGEAYRPRQTLCVMGADGVVDEVEVDEDGEQIDE